jgi:hypothetical protein
MSTPIYFLFRRFLAGTFIFIFAAVSIQAALQSNDILTLSPAEIEAQLPNEHPSTYYLYAGRLMKAGDLSGALRWFYIGQLRWRIDLLAHPGQHGGQDDGLFGLINQSLEKPLTEYGASHMDQWLAAIDAALAWDDAHDNGDTAKDKFPSIYAAQRARLVKLKSYIANHKDLSTLDIPSPDESFLDKKEAALAEAAMAGDIQKIDELTQAGVNPDAFSKEGLPILAWVMMAKNHEGFKALLDHHANPEAPVKHRGLRPSVLSMAILNKEDYYFEQLILHRANPDFLLDVPTKRTLIYDTILYDRQELTVILIKAGADVNHRNIINETPLISTLSGAFRPKAALALLQAGADWKPTNKYGKGLIDYLLIIAKKGKPEDHAKPWWKDYVNVVQWLSDHGATIPDEFKALVPELNAPKSN